MVKKYLERDVIKAIKMQLKFFVPEVIIIDRLQSGVVRTQGRFIHMCQTGTPDLYAIVKHAGDGHTVFIECKSPHGGVQSVEQRMFENKLRDLHNVHYVLARSCADVIAYIKTEITEKRDDYHNG